MPIPLRLPRSSWSRLALVVVLLAVLAPAVGRAEPGPPAPDLCGPDDRPEEGIQGHVPLSDQLNGRAEEGYSCGLRLVGFDSLGGRAGNANMAWAGDCAYVSGDGIAVIDVSDPTAPEHVTTLRGPGSTNTIETLHARSHGDRAVLAAGRYGIQPFGGPTPVDLYDVSDCARPVKTATIWFPANVHNLLVSPDTTRLFSTMPVQVFDIGDLHQPELLGNLEWQLRDRATPEMAFRHNYLSHEAELSADGDTLYVGGQLPVFDTFTIIDIAEWPERPARILHQGRGRGHSVRRARIDGVPHLLHGEESIVSPTAVGCLSEELNPVAGAAQPWLTEISDPTDPRTAVSQLRLEINEPRHCLAQLASQVNASVHYHEVDDPDDTTFAMLSMWNAGLRVVDIRDPARPTEVAYFNPGAIATDSGTVLDRAWGHPRWVPETGHIWFATAHGGFWVVELEPQVRDHLGLDHPTEAWASAHSEPRPAPTRVPRSRSAAAVTALYCTVGGVGALASGGGPPPPAPGRRAHRPALPRRGCGSLGVGRARRARRAPGGRAPGSAQPPLSATRAGTTWRTPRRW